MPEKEPIGVIGVGWVGLCTAACFAELGHEVYARDIVPEKVDGARARRGADARARAPRAGASATPSACTSPPTWARCSTNASLLFCCVDTPPTYSGDADLSRVEAVITELGESDGHAIVMKSTVPVGTGRSITATLPGRRLRVEPRVPQGGLARSRTS